VIFASDYATDVIKITGRRRFGGGVRGAPRAAGDRVNDDDSRPSDVDRRHHLDAGYVAEQELLPQLVLNDDRRQREAGGAKSDGGQQATTNGRDHDDDDDASVTTTPSSGDFTSESDVGGDVISHVSSDVIVDRQQDDDVYGRVGGGCEADDTRLRDKENKLAKGEQ